jgi:rhodanese-related sulfurtransferase
LERGSCRRAKHLSRGTIELEIEERVPDLKRSIICYCGGGSRSALVTESLQKMGYENVRSMTGGLRAWKEAGLPMV